MRSYPSCQKLPVYKSRCVRMPANSFGELRLYVVIDQFSGKDVVPWFAEASRS